LRISVLALLAALSATASYAQTTLTPVSAFVQLEANDSFVSYSGLSPYDFLPSHTFAGSGGSAAGGNLSGADPTVMSSINVSPLGHSASLIQDFDSESWIYYEFAVDGPADETVDIDFSSSGSAEVSSLAPSLDFNSTAYLDVTQATTGAVLLTGTACAGAPSDESDPCGETSGPLTSSFNLNQTLTVETNTAYLVDIFTDDSLSEPQSGNPGSYFATSTVDPTITLDTTDPAYSLEYSAGLGVPSSSATPEPSTLMLVATGLSGAFSLARRRLLRG
jgi:hypothetical protein